MFRKRYRSQREIEEIMGRSDHEIANRILYADTVDLVVLPPETADAVSDTENIDDEEQIMNDENEFLPHEIAGHIELSCTYNDDNPNASTDCDETAEHSVEFEADTSSRETQQKRSRKEVNLFEPKWIKAKKMKYSRELPVNKEIEKMEELYRKYGEYSPIQLFNLFIDDEMIKYLVRCTINYAKIDHNDLKFEMDDEEMRRFIGILFVTGYNARPRIENYWSNQSSLECNIIRRAMAHDRFKLIKKYFHVCDNQKIDARDKFAKVTPWNIILNERFMQFGIFSHNLSIDEQMIAYFGRHSCKMFIKGKPIRFGFKYWDLCSSDGYLYSFIPYSGADENREPEYKDCSLAQKVVLKLLKLLDDPREHCVAFNNFFTSHKLMSQLTSLGYYATGTIRDNRLNEAKLTDVSSSKKKDRGWLDYTFDRNNNVLIVRWNDNSVLTIATNHEEIEPLHRVKRWNGGKKCYVDMPQVVKAYNNRMGGVQLFDNAMNHYRIRVRGKKWYWPLITNGLDAAMVNSWKIHSALFKYEKGMSRTTERCMTQKTEPLDQLLFRTHVAECLLRMAITPISTLETFTPQSTAIRKSKDAALESVRKDKIGHGIEKLEKPRRCQNCHKHSSYKCTKCEVALHVLCFNEFHEI
ncbi:piggyBac transposable element-derived protein 3-like [Belonocnema kinseyi]|uniref:piggyBac transposable element-derived protein 3-like n=1 Tax=Belonocnema kinseyi TaxID=2817044 RepID=UPI00143CC70E|nr:piggyBac transposable element-derived protein 3-like [Belonocnema kinseyi]